MRRKYYLSNQKGMTLLEILGGILLFTLACIFVSSLSSSTMNKSKIASIQVDMDLYHYQASDVLAEAATNPDPTKLELTFNEVLRGNTKFVGKKSIAPNTFNNPYTLDITADESQTAIIIETQGRSQAETFKIVVVKEGDTVEACSYGFGDKNRYLQTLQSPHCSSHLIPEGYIAIWNAHDLNNVRNKLNANYIVMRNINLAKSPYVKDANGWEPLGTSSTNAFTGIFLGNNKIVSGLKANQNVTNTALFGYIKNATFSNLTLKDATVTGNTNTAIFAGTADNSKIAGIHVTGTVNGIAKVGGLIGVATKTTIESSSSQGNIYGTTVGGLTATVTDSFISDSFSTANVRSTDKADFTGGLTATASNTILKNVYTTGDIISPKSHDPVGGITALLTNNSKIINAYTTGFIQGTRSTGGVAGEVVNSSIQHSHFSGHLFTNTPSSSFLGGIAGRSNGLIETSYSDGIIEVESDNTGGIVGEAYDNAIIRNTYSTSPITARTQTGGIVGWLNTGALVEKSFAAGKVTSHFTHTGGLVGVDKTKKGEGGVVSSFYDRQTTQKTDTGKGIPKTTSDMYKKSTYTGWDFNNIWTIVEGVFYPVLK